MEEVKELKRINDHLLNDVKRINEKLMQVLVPGAIQKENEELKETIQILQTVIAIYKQAELDEEQPRDKTAESEHATRIQNKQGILCTIVDIETLQVIQSMV